MSDGLAAVQSRIAEIQNLIGARPSGIATGVSTTSDSFASALDTATSGSTTGSGTTNTGQTAVDIAKKYLGVPYKWGGTDPDTGLDCSGLVQLVYQQLGVNLPRTSAAQSTVGTQIDSLAQAKPGDLLFFGNPVHHVGIYIGDGKMLNAPHTGANVRIENVWGTPSSIRRVLPSGTSSDGSSLLSSLTSSQPGTTSPAMSAASLLSSSSTGGLSGTPYASLFTAAGKKYGVDPALLSAVAKAESSYNPNATSGAGARGLMQLMPGTAQELGVTDPTDPAQAINGAAKLLSQNLRSFNGRVDLALAAYNAGAGNVRKYNGIPPFTETQNYVKRVTGYWGELR